MFPDINSDFDLAEFRHKSMWEAFLEQRRVEMTPSDSDEDADEAPEPKKGKSSPVKGAKGESVDSDEDPHSAKVPSCQAAVMGVGRHRPLLEEE